MNKVNIGMTGSKGSISIVLDVLPDNLAELLTLANQIVNGNDGEAALTESDKELLVLMRKGTKLQAVKLKKDISGIGLKEAKEYCDALEAKYIK